MTQAHPQANLKPEEAVRDASLPVSPSLPGRQNTEKTLDGLAYVARVGNPLYVEIELKGETWNTLILEKDVREAFEAENYEVELAYVYKTYVPSEKKRKIYAVFRIENTFLTPSLHPLGGG
jgi:hypothetical protein